MKTYVKNILLYLVALLGLLAFIALFSNPLQSYDEIKGTWSIITLRAYLGDNVSYKGAGLPVVGFVIPLVLAIVVIIESFKSKWLARLKVINTFIAVLFFISAVLVLLTKECFLSVNDLGETQLLRNGGGPIFSAVCSSLAGALCLFVSWFPSKSSIQFIEK